MKNPVRVAVTGAAGQIGYALLFRIAAGEMLGRDQPVILQLLELPIEKPQAALKGVMMELEDCAFPLLAGMIGTGDPNVAFRDADYALLVGARPRGPGMERKDLLLENAKIFIEQGKALDAVAKRDIRVLVVGNPANTNAYIAMRSAPSLPKKNFTAMLRLDHNRALSQLAAKTGKPVGAIEKLIVWGNHSPTMYADYRFATVGDQSVKDLINDDNWNRNVFLPIVGKRGAAIIEARGMSSAASAANAAVDHVRDWTQGTSGRWVTMGVASDGSYGIPQDVMYGVPVTTAGGEYTRVAGLPIDDFSREKMDATLKELEEERAGVASLLGRLMTASSAGARFRAAVAAERPLQVPGAICAYHAILAERSGFKAIYLSGGGVAAGSLGVPDLGISNLDDVLTDVRRITDACALPLLVDVDTGFGASAFNIARTVKSLIKFGAGAMHIEDQVGAKRCGHRPGKELVSQDEMVDRIKAAVDARTDPEFVVMARTDALAVEGLEAAIDRASACVAAGADMIFPEAMTELVDVQGVRRGGQGADPCQHHRVRLDAALHAGRARAAPMSPWPCIRSRRSAR